MAWLEVQTTQKTGLVAVVMNLTIEIELITVSGNAVQAGVGDGVVLSNKKATNEGGKDEDECYELFHEWTSLVGVVFETLESVVELL